MKQARPALIALLAWLAMACTPVVPAPSPRTPEPGTAAPSPAPASPEAPEPTGLPSSPSPVAGPFTPALQVPGAARVTVDTLAVRTSPDTDASQVDGVDADGEVVTPNLFVGTDALVRVLAGPLEHQGIAWYRVAPIPGAADDLRWESGDPGRPGQGWLAGGQDGTPYLEPVDPPPEPTPSPGETAPPPRPEVVFAESGRGASLSAGFDTAAEPVVEWDAADPDGDGCRFSLFISGASGTREVVSGSIARTEGANWPARGLPAGRYTLRIDGDCAWAVVVAQPAGG